MLIHLNLPQNIFKANKQNKSFQKILDFPDEGICPIMGNPLQGGTLEYSSMRGILSTNS